MMYKALWVAVLFFLFYLVFLQNVLYIDIPNGCFIKIVPGLELNNAKVIQGLKILKNLSPEDYKEACKRAETIDPNVGCGGFEGGCFYQTEPKKIYVTTAGTPLMWVAGVLVHETCHARQFAEKRLMSEDECYREDDRVIKKIVVY